MEDTAINKNSNKIKDYVLATTKNMSKEIRVIILVLIKKRIPYLSVDVFFSIFEAYLPHTNIENKTLALLMKVKNPYLIKYREIGHKSAQYIMIKNFIKGI